MSGRKIILAVALFVATLQLTAQKQIFEPQFYLGVNGGAMMPTIDFLPKVMQKSELGVVGGLSARYITEKNLGLLVELNYAQRGWNEDHEDFPDRSYRRTLNYIELPFMTHVYFGKKVKFVVNAGPQIAYLLNSSATMSDEMSDYIDRLHQSTNPNAAAQYRDDFKRFDYGIIGGAGVGMNMGSGDLFLEGRYYFGLGDIFESRKSKENFYFNRSAHRIIEVKLSYYFKLK